MLDAHKSTKNLEMTKDCGGVHRIADGGPLRLPTSQLQEPSSVEELADRLGLRVHEYIGGAPVLGSLDEELMEKPIWMSKSSNSKSAKAKEWKEVRTVEDLMVELAEHKPGGKDGPAFLQGFVLGSVRKKSAMESMDVMAFDLDNGTTLSDVVERVSAANIFTIIYTTHSHGKVRTQVKRDDLMKFAGDDQAAITDELAGRYLASRGFTSAICASATVDEIKATPDGRMASITHLPIQKYRVVTVLKDPFIFFNRGGTDRQAQEEWASLYAGAASMLGLPYDKSCTDPSRLFFTPRHPPGSEDFQVLVVAGEALDIDNIPTVQQAAPPPSTKHSAAPRFLQKGTAPTRLATTDLAKGIESVTPKTIGLKRFLAQNGRGFDALSFAREYLEVRSDGVHKLEARCPNDGEHTDAGNPEDRAFCVFAGDESKGFNMACRHAHCQGIDRLGFIDLICQENSLNVKDLGRYTENTSRNDDGTGVATFEGGEDYQDQLRELDRTLTRLGLCREGGFIGRHQGEDGDMFRPICREVLPLARSVDEHGNGASLVLRFPDHGGRWREDIVSLADVHENGRKVRRTLADAGLQIFARASAEFDNMLTAFNPTREIVVTRRPGWHGDAFLTPSGETVGQDSREFRLLDAFKDARRGSQEGQLKAFDAALRSGVDHFAVGVLLAGVGPIVSRTQSPNVIVALVGESSRGKTTALKIAASAWGNPAAGKGSHILCRTTSNRLEVDAERRNGSLLALDEFRLVPPSEAQNLIFTLSQGNGKRRLTSDATGKPVGEWSTVVVISSERSLDAIVRDTGDVVQTGMAVRTMEIDVSHAPDLDRAAMLDIEQVQEHHGHLGPLIADFIGRHRAPEDIMASIEANQTILAGPGASSKVRRSAYSAAVLLESGRVMQQAGVIAPEFDLDALIKRLWVTQKESLVGRLQPIDEAILRLQENLLSRHGVDVFDVADEVGGTPRHRAAKAWYSAENRGGTPTVLYHISPNELENFAGGAVTRRPLLRALKDKGFLDDTCAGGMVWDRVPGLGSARWRNYRVRFLSAADEENEKPGI
ncbi:DUF927 domain-containing protein [Aurantimonas sp. DM33-3]|uniref:DUF927 domain-containing protein n=1 Tax=Aurantimonas sp. DM33-3 TaxID=2766955 RepID=UPI0016525BCA|nr:DUF927 domain-containing protein [Aurantimonas sp. DM33-3]MBC6717495.1 DUF927 domain-containing protein [Aurantimonas sp. DM33-3]